MSTTTTVCSDPDQFPALDVAATFSKIVEHNRKANEGIGHMIEAGKLLTLLKGRLPHGQFIKLALSETQLSRSTISRYMQMAANAPRVGHLKSGRDAIETIAALSREIAAPAPAPRPAPASSKPPLPLGATYQDAEIVEQEAPVIEPEPIDDETEPLVVDGTSDEIIEKENPWVTSRQAIAELAKLDGKISSPLGDVLAYIEKRWDLTFNLKVQKQ